MVCGKIIAHVLVELDGKYRNVRKRCKGCYDMISQNEGSSIADKKARRVKTVCSYCKNRPALSIPCFKRLRNNNFHTIVWHS